MLLAKWDLHIYSDEGLDDEPETVKTAIRRTLEAVDPPKPTADETFRLYAAGATHAMEKCLMLREEGDDEELAVWVRALHRLIGFQIGTVRNEFGEEVPQ